jgi:hypothetical protein
MRDFPHESELRAVKTQKKLACLSYGCIALLGGNLYLWDRGFCIVPAASGVFFLLCISILARAVSVFRDGFFVRGSRIVRGGYGIALALARLGAELVIGVLLLSAMNS